MVVYNSANDDIPIAAGNSIAVSFSPFDVSKLTMVSTAEIMSNTTAAMVLINTLLSTPCLLFMIMVFYRNYLTTKILYGVGVDKLF